MGIPSQCHWICHEEHEYIWFGGRDLNDFLRYKTFNEMEEVEHAP